MNRTLPVTLLIAVPLLAGAVALSQGSPSTPELKAGQPDLTHGAMLAGECASCHGPTGRAPVLKGEPADQLQRALLAFRSGTRRNGTMQAVASRMSDQDIVDVAAFFAGTTPAAAPPTPAAPAAAPAAPAAPPAAKTGETLYLEGDPARDLLACAVCHGEDGKGADAVGIPAIAGRSAANVLATLKEYHAMPAVGIAYPDAMRIAVKPLSDQDMKAVSDFVATLK